MVLNEVFFISKRHEREKGISLPAREMALASRDNLTSGNRGYHAYDFIVLHHKCFGTLHQWITWANVGTVDSLFKSKALSLEALNAARQ